MNNIITAAEPVTGAATNETKRLFEVVQPLLDALNERFPTDGLEEYQLTIVDTFRDEPDPDLRTLVELPCNLAEHPLAVRAILTILQATGSEDVWASGKSESNASPCGPLRFSLAKRAAWGGYFWRWDRFLVVEPICGDLDVQAAAEQIEALLAELSDEQNLVKVGREELELF